MLRNCVISCGIYSTKEIKEKDSPIPGNLVFKYDKVFKDFVKEELFEEIETENNTLKKELKGTEINLDYITKEYLNYLIVKNLRTYEKYI